MLLSNGGNLWGTGKDGEETGSLGGVWKFFFSRGQGIRGSPEELGVGESCAMTEGLGRQQSER